MQISASVYKVAQNSVLKNGISDRLNKEHLRFHYDRRCFSGRGESKIGLSRARLRRRICS